RSGVMSQPHLMILCALLTACGHASADPPSAAPHPPARGTSAAPEGRARVRFDLARRFERADLFEGRASFIDLGTPGGAKHTWGGGYTRVGPDRELDGATAAITTGARAKLTIAAEGGEATIAVRLRAFRAGTAHLYLGDRELTTATLAADTWSVITTQA